ncbi:unnamed protein product, partial [Thlaspi arvense]
LDRITMKIFHRFRKILMRLIDLTLPSSSRRQKNSGNVERFEPPKISCSSSYYSSHVHYSEAIADCIEFFNKSSAISSCDEDNDACHVDDHDDRNCDPKQEKINMKLLHKFRKRLIRFIDLTHPSSSRRQKKKFERPKISCGSSYYSCDVHYSEAIADCIEFCNKSSALSCDEDHESCHVDNHNRESTSQSSPF